jgi:hypothetical protein
MRAAFFKKVGAAVKAVADSNKIETLHAVKANVIECMIHFASFRCNDGL